MSSRPDLVTIAAAVSSEQIIKGSRFLGFADRCGSEREATAVVERLRGEHRAANHVCFAYRVGEIVRFSDDGEPGGTAGRPLAEVLTKRELDLVVGVVVRYFGGVKLGAGGLVRAYSGTLATTLDSAGVVRLPARVEVEVSAPFGASDALFRLLDERAEVERGEVAYRAEGVTIAVRLPERELAHLERLVRDATRGSGTLSAARDLPHLNDV